MSQSTKPIFTVKHYFENYEDRDKRFDAIQSIQRNLQIKMPDYHILVVPLIKTEATENLDVVFDCFYPNKLNEKDWEDFKIDVKREIQSHK